MINYTNAWEEAHSLYDPSPAHLDEYMTQGIHSPLLGQNTFINSLREAQKLYFLHITTALEILLTTGEMHASGGCLVGSVYCTPLTQLKNGSLKAHNLGSYIYSQEVQRSIRSRKKSGIVISPLIIEVEATPGHRMEGINYLRMGRQHLQAYSTLSHDIPAHTQTNFTKAITENIVNSSSFWEMCLDVAHNRKVIDRHMFFELLNTTTANMPIIGYFYFEAIIEYIMLHSKDGESIRYASQQEFNNWSYKDFIFQLAPHLLVNFNLGSFSPTLEQLIKTSRIMNSMATLHINVDSFITSVMLRISTMISSLLLSGIDSTASITKEMAFSDLAEYLPNLVGHSIDRSVRQLKELRDFTHKYDKHKAEQVWQYWNEKKIAFPFNGIIPKGEVGINPTASLKHRVYAAKATMHGKDLHLERGVGLPLKIVPEFLSASHAFMGIKN